MFKKNELNVLYATDDNFCEVTAASIISLLENNHLVFQKINIYIITNEISTENKEHILDLSKSFPVAQIIFIPVLDIYNELPVGVNVDRGSIAQYSRLFVARFLSEKVSRVLYLDADTLVVGSLFEFWNLNMGEKTVGTLLDAFSSVYRRNIQLKPKDIMFNSGVMLINLDRWRQNHIEDKLILYIHDVKGQIQQGDQGALNNILYNQTMNISPKYNVLTVFFDFSYKELLIYRKPPYFYSKYEIEIAKKKPVIIHFTTSFLSNRPWEKGSNHPYATKWTSYKRKTAWRTEPAKNRKRGMLTAIYFNFSKFVPRQIYVALSGVLHAYLRPLIFSTTHLFFKEHIIKQSIKKSESN